MQNDYIGYKWPSPAKTEYDALRKIPKKALSRAQVNRLGVLKLLFEMKKGNVTVTPKLLDQVFGDLDPVDITSQRSSAQGIETPAWITDEKSIAHYWAYIPLKVPVQASLLEKDRDENYTVNGPSNRVCLAIQRFFEDPNHPIRAFYRKKRTLTFEVGILWEQAPDPQCRPKIPHQTFDMLYLCFQHMGAYRDRIDVKYYFTDCQIDEGVWGDKRVIPDTCSIKRELSSLVDRGLNLYGRYLDGVLGPEHFIRIPPGTPLNDHIDRIRGLISTKTLNSYRALWTSGIGSQRRRAYVKWEFIRALGWEYITDVNSSGYDPEVIWYLTCLRRGVPFTHPVMADTRLNMVVRDSFFD